MNHPIEPIRRFLEQYDALLASGLAVPMQLPDLVCAIKGADVRIRDLRRLVEWADELRNEAREARRME